MNINNRADIGVRKTIIAIIISALIIVFLVLIKLKNTTEDETVDNIHSEIWNIFNEAKITLVSDEYDEYVDERENNDSGWDTVGYFVYNDDKYVPFRYTIDKGLVDISQCILEVSRYDNEALYAKVYKLKDVSEEYMLVAEVDGLYHQFVNMNFKHDKLEEYIERIGPKDKLDIVCVEVKLIENRAVKNKYVFDTNIDKWVWNLLLSEEHKFIGAVESCSMLNEDIYPDKMGDINICIRNKLANAQYMVTILPSGNLAISDDRSNVHDFEYEMSEEKLIEALQELVNYYDAYKVD